MTRTREEIAREFAGYVLLVGGGLLLLALVSYHPLDPWSVSYTHLTLPTIYSV